MLAIRVQHRPKADVDRLYGSQKTGREGPNALGRRLRSRNYKTGEICRQKVRSTTTDCQKAPT